MSLSMVTLVFSAKYFGVSLERDIWILVATFITTIGSAVWGPINETFRTKFIFIKEQEGIESASSKTVSLISYIIGITLLISLAILIFKVPLAYYLSSGNTSSSSIELYCSLLVVILPSMLINQLTQIGISILNAYDIYYIPEVVGAASSIINVLVIISLAPIIGIFSLAVSQYIALLLLLIAILYYLKRLKLFHWRDFQSVKYKDFYAFLLFALPFFIPYIVGQCNAMAEKWLAGLLGEGYISSLDYARQFTTVLQSVISSVLTTVMVPLLAKAYSQNDKKQADLIVRENLTVCFAILAFALPVLFGAASPLCEFFFLRGKVSQESLEIIIRLMRLYSFAFIGVLLYMIIGYALLTSNQAKRYAAWGVLVQLVVLVLNISFIKVTGVYTFPVSLGIAHLIGAAIMSRYLCLDRMNMFYSKIVKYCFVIVSITTVIYFFNLYIEAGTSFVQLMLNVPVLVVVYFIASHWLDVNILAYTRGIYLKIKSKW